jgi:hypothetical protein
VTVLSILKDTGHASESSEILWSSEPIEVEGSEENAAAGVTWRHDQRWLGWLGNKNPLRDALEDFVLHGGEYPLVEEGVNKLLDEHIEAEVLIGEVLNYISKIVYT